MPAEQRTQALLLTAIFNGLKVPELQFVNIVFPLLGPQKEPAGQGWQVTAPASGLKVPGEQGTQALLSSIIFDGLKVPALQFVNTVFPLLGPQNEPAGHGRHEATLLA